MPKPFPVVAAAVPVTLVALLLAAGGAAADVYKCVGDHGVPVYQEMPCPTGKSLRDFQVDPPDITVLPAQSATGAAAPASAERGKKEPRPAKSPKPARATADSSERKHLRRGMTTGEVRARIGPPDSTATPKNAKIQRWMYEPAAGDPETLTILTISEGFVTDIERRIVKK